LKNTIIVGYSGHSYVVIDAILKNGNTVKYYLDITAKQKNPYGLAYLGKENEPDNLNFLRENEYFIAIGDNYVRKEITDFISRIIQKPISIIHKTAILTEKIQILTGVFVGANVVVNPLAEIGQGSILNTNCVVEHECKIGNFCHIAPSATLCGNVEIGDLSFIGANSVIKEGIRIGKNVTIGAGSVVIKNVPDNATIAGNPARVLNTINLE
jgi:sugar O-acyltransferase (sialic acid O-acetyltransferase NeuD family)